MLCFWPHCLCVPLASSPTLFAMFIFSVISAATTAITSSFFGLPTWTEVQCLLGNPPDLQHQSVTAELTSLPV